MLAALRDLIDWVPMGLPAWLVVVTLVVFFHELGHFAVARFFGVKVETFSIGFGREIFGRTDGKGTRWKVSWIPLGGYVKFLGDADASSRPDRERVEAMTADERAGSLPSKPVYQRALVAAAGPVANFIFAILVYTLLFTFMGGRALSTYVGAVTPNSPAAAAGIHAGDKIVAIAGRQVKFFTDLRPLLEHAKGKAVTLAVERDKRTVDLVVTPNTLKTTDLFGSAIQIVGIGIAPDAEDSRNLIHVAVPLWEAPQAALAQSWFIVDASLTYLWRMIVGHADSSQMSGPLGMAKVAKTAASHGLYDLISLMAFISVSLGLVNLFPIPVLDGGHLLYYGCEAVLGHPLGERAQDVGFRFGLALVLGVMLFVTWNDLVRLNLF